MAFFTYIGLIIIVYYLLYLVLFFLIDCDIILFLAEKFGKKGSKLRGKIIWIVEADNEVGEALAYEVARNNGKIILSASRSNALELIKEKCLKINSSLRSEDIFILPVDLSRTETHKSCFKCVLQHFGLVDILISSIGKAEIAIWEDILVSTDRKLFESNVFGIISMSRIAVHYFASKGKGHIAIVSSLAGVIGVPYSSTFVACAHALHGYFESLRNEKLGTHLQVTLLCPGPVTSEVDDFIRPVLETDKGSKDERKEMVIKRYAQLSVIAIVNKLDEAWMAPPPIIPLIYAVTNFPNVARIITGIISRRKFKWLIDAEVR